jgi:hypothetical protein
MKFASLVLLAVVVSLMTFAVLRTILPPLSPPCAVAIDRCPGCLCGCAGGKACVCGQTKEPPKCCEPGPARVRGIIQP